MSDNKFKNFAVLTLDIQSVEVKDSKKGGQYAVAEALLQPGEGKHSDAIPMPFRVIVTNGLTKVLKPGITMTLVGHIGYEERDGESIYLFFPYKYDKPDKANGKDIAHSFVQLTLRAGKEATCRYTESGIYWGYTRMALGMGKIDGDAEHRTPIYKPSLWFAVKAFSRDGDESLPLKLAAIAKGSLVTVSGRLAYEAFIDKEGQERVSAGLIASKISDFEGVTSEAESEDQAEQEFEEPDFG